MQPKDGHWRLLGGCVGLLCAVAFGLAGGAVADSGSSGAEVRMTAGPTGELSVSPRSAFLEAIDLRPGHHVVGNLVVRNQTGAALAVVAKATSASTPALLDVFHVRVRAGDHVVAEGPMSVLLAGTAPWSLASGQQTEMTVETWVEPADDRNKAAIVDLGIHLEARPEQR